MSILNNLSAVVREIPSGVKLVAVSKTIPPEVILETWRAGQRIFGENKAQELIYKQPLLPADIQWHFIGHLQTNKVKHIVPLVEMIEAVDSMKLLSEIDKEAAKCHRIVKCLLQFHIATEETKFGLDMQEAKTILESNEFKILNNIQLAGVMGMATLTGNEGVIRQEFRELVRIFNFLKSSFFPGDPEFKEISMGMSGDFKLAIEEGSTIVRIGTAIFGER